MVVCSTCGGLLYCDACKCVRGYFRVRHHHFDSGCEACADKGCDCVPALQHPCISDWYWKGGVQGLLMHEGKAHGTVHYPPGTRVPSGMTDHGRISTSCIQSVVSVQYSLVRTFSGSIYQLDAGSRNPQCLALAQRHIVAPLDLMYLHHLLQAGRATLRDDAPLAGLWQLSSALFEMMMAKMLPYLGSM